MFLLFIDFLDFFTVCRDYTRFAPGAITNALAQDISCVRVDKSLLWTTWPCDTSAYHTQLDYIACADFTPKPTPAPNASAVLVTKKSTDVKNESAYV